MKICRQCQKKFNQNSNSQKVCGESCRVRDRREYRLRYHYSHKQDKRKYNKMWRLGNAEHIRKWRSRYNLARREHNLEYNAKYYAKNRELILAKAFNRRCNLDDRYVLSTLISHSPGLCQKDFPPEIVEIKRQQIRLLRASRNQMQII